LTSRVLYRVASVLIVLFDVGHTLAFPWSDPAWGVDTGAMRTAHFQILGFRRTYWDFYVGFGLIQSVLLLFAAVLAWQLGGVPKEASSSVRLTSWALTICFLALAVLSARYFFTIPIVFSGLITLCLATATARSSRTP
jgi:hypothetical protein